MDDRVGHSDKPRPEGSAIIWFRRSKSLPGRQVETTFEVRRSAVAFVGALFLLLVTLKLTHIVAWSWWWISMPVWGSAALVVGVVVITVWLDSDWLDAWRRRRARRTSTNHPTYFRERRSR